MVNFQILLFDMLAPFSLLQLVKNEIWRSHNSKSDYAAGCLSSVVLDWKLPYSKSKKDNRFVYHFLRNGLPSLSERTSKGDFLNAASSPTKEVDCALRCGDFVVCFIFIMCFCVVHMRLFVQV